MSVTQDPSFLNLAEVVEKAEELLVVLISELIVGCCRNLSAWLTLTNGGEFLGF